MLLPQSAPQGSAGGLQEVAKWHSSPMFASGRIGTQPSPTSILHGPSGNTSAPAPPLDPAAPAAPSRSLPASGSPPAPPLPAPPSVPADAPAPEPAALPPAPLRPAAPPAPPRSPESVPSVPAPPPCPDAPADPPALPAADASEPPSHDASGDGSNPRPHAKAPAATMAQQAATRRIPSKDPMRISADPKQAMCHRGSGAILASCAPHACVSGPRPGTVVTRLDGGQWPRFVPPLRDRSGRLTSSQNGRICLGQARDFAP